MNTRKEPVPLKRIVNRTPLEQDAWDAYRLGLTYGEFKSKYPAGLPKALREKKGSGT